MSRIRDLKLDRLDGYEDRSEYQICHKTSPEIHHAHVELIRPLWSVAKRQYETCQ